jgi:transposase-like protein
MNLIDFIYLTSDKENARSIFEHLCWPGGPACPACGSIHQGRKSYNEMYVCKCGRHYSVTSDSPLRKTRLEANRLMLAIYLLSANRKLTSKQLALMVGTTYATAYSLRTRIWQFMSEYEWAAQLSDLSIEDLAQRGNLLIKRLNGAAITEQNFDLTQHWRRG